MLEADTRRLRHPEKPTALARKRREVVCLLLDCTVRQVLKVDETVLRVRNAVIHNRQLAALTFSNRDGDDTRGFLAQLGCVVLPRRLGINLVAVVDR